MTPVTLAAETVEKIRQYDGQKLAIIITHLSSGKKAEPWMVNTLEGLFARLIDLQEALPTPEPAGRDAETMPPCPFCGEILGLFDDIAGYRRHSMNKCLLRGFIVDELDKRWNTRARTGMSATE